jgi:hypothetical protein
MHYRNDEVLKNGIDSTKSTASFSEAWNVIRRDSFQNLAEFCGVIATLFPGTCTVESDFSTLRWQKDDFCKSLSDFGLEAVLQAKPGFLSTPTLLFCHPRRNADDVSKPPEPITEEKGAGDGCKFLCNPIYKTKTEFY